MCAGEEGKKFLQVHVREGAKCKHHTCALNIYFTIQPTNHPSSRPFSHSATQFYTQPYSQQTNHPSIYVYNNIRKKFVNNVFFSVYLFHNSVGGVGFVVFIVNCGHREGWYIYEIGFNRKT